MQVIMVSLLRQHEKLLVGAMSWLFSKGMAPGNSPFMLGNYCIQQRSAAQQECTWQAEIGLLSKPVKL